MTTKKDPKRPKVRCVKCYRIIRAREYMAYDWGVIPGGKTEVELRGQHIVCP